MPAVTRIPVGSAWVDLISRGDRICAHLKSGKEFETESLLVWGELCREGATVVDVGGYTGLFSISAGLLGTKAVTIEPMAVNADRIAENVALNGVSNWVRLIRAAASDRVGHIELTWNPNVDGLTSGASLVRKTGNKAMVEAVTIDSLKLPPVAAIKIDVERAEAMVLRGARRTIERDRPTLLVEALDAVLREAVLAELPGYRVAAVLDVRNLLMVPA